MDNVYFLLPSYLDDKWLNILALPARYLGIPIRRSLDDMPDNSRKVFIVAVNPEYIGKGLTQEWLNRHRPGVRLIPIRAASKTELLKALQRGVPEADLPPRFPVGSEFKPSHFIL